MSAALLSEERLLRLIVPMITVTRTMVQKLSASCAERLRFLSLIVVSRKVENVRMVERHIAW
ncbi:hypothetical protein XaFJ1_GM001347 [Xanthomonas albilineans]|nr:hypothetical protein XaFJ1_GM001347 [Xanthomonas albilineans]